MLPDAAAVGFDGRAIAVAHVVDDDPVLSIFDATSGEASARAVKLVGVVERLRWAPDGGRLAILTRLEKGTPTTALHLYHAATAKLTTTPVRGDIQVAFAPTSQQIVVAHWGNLEFHSSEGDRLDRTITGEGRVTAFAVRSDGTRVALARRQRRSTAVEVWDLATEKTVQRAVVGDHAVPAFAWSADWSLLAWVENGPEDVHHVATMDRYGTVTRSRDPVGSAAHDVVFSPDGRWLMSLSSGPTVWSTTDVTRHLDLRPGDEQRWGGAFLPDVDRLALFTDSALRRVDVASGRTLGSTEVELGPRASAHAFSSDGRWLVAVSSVKTQLVPVPPPR